MQLLPAPTAGDHQACVLQDAEVLGDPEAGHVETGLKGAQRLPVLAEQLVEKVPPGGVGERLEHVVHAPIIGD
jgi:hypothetical protein